ncbi:hypothetical protein [Symmachiella dynata]|uniref:hypothetical protein n=1 Tax=Symmachiella dynata TaxID=2527995 RepID=UPI0011A10B6C|nr:hypothetical protein [Symmachiella dynata]
MAGDELSKAEQRLHATLQTSSSIDIQDVKLTDAIQSLATLNDLQIVIDHEELVKQGIDPDALINYKVDSIKLGHVLTLLLEPLELGWMVRDGVITITTAQIAVGPNVKTVYHQYAKFEDVIKTKDTKAAKTAFQKAIYATIAPKSWRDAGGEGTIDWTENGLVMTNRAAVQKKFEQLTWYLTQGHKLIRSREKSFPLTNNDAPRVLNALAEQTNPGNVGMVDIPLTDVMVFFSRLHDINILVDRIALHDVGIRADPPVTLQPEGASLQQALDQALKPLKLDYIARHEVLFITTPEKVNALPETHIYDVQKLLGPNVEPSVITEEITTKVLPKTWSPNGGHGTMAYVPGYFIVYQTPRAHRKILERFKTLRQRLDGNAVEKP